MNRLIIFASVFSMVAGLLVLSHHKTNKEVLVGPIRAKSVVQNEVKPIEDLKKFAATEQGSNSKDVGRPSTVPADAVCELPGVAKMTFAEYLDAIEKNPDYCGSKATPGIIKKCRSSGSNADMGAECIYMYRKFLSLQVKLSEQQRLDQMSESLFKAHLGNLLFSENGVNRKTTKQMMPFVTELLNRNPYNVGYMRVFVMLKSAYLIEDALTEKDHEILNRTLLNDSQSSSTRGALINIFTRQLDGFNKIAQIARMYPDDIYAYATIVGRHLLANDRKSALKWAESGLAKNPGNEKFVKLKQDIENKKFDIENYRDIAFDISAAFDGSI